MFCHPMRYLVVSSKHLEYKNRPLVFLFFCHGTEQRFYFFLCLQPSSSSHYQVLWIPIPKDNPCTSSPFTTVTSPNHYYSLHGELYVALKLAPWFFLSFPVPYTQLCISQAFLKLLFRSELISSSHMVWTLVSPYKASPPPFKLTIQSLWMLFLDSLLFDPSHHFCYLESISFNPKVTSERP